MLVSSPRHRALAPASPILLSDRSNLLSARFADRLLPTARHPSSPISFFPSCSSVSAKLWWRAAASSTAPLHPCHVHGSPSVQLAAPDAQARQPRVPRPPHVRIPAHARGDLGDPSPQDGAAGQVEAKQRGVALEHVREVLGRKGVERAAPELQAPDGSRGSSESVRMLPCAADVLEGGGGGGGRRKTAGSRRLHVPHPVDAGQGTRLGDGVGENGDGDVVEDVAVDALLVNLLLLVGERERQQRRRPLDRLRHPQHPLVADLAVIGDQGGQRAAVEDCVGDERDSRAANGVAGDVEEGDGGAAVREAC
eukprot:759018-Hanusia_phi.AAC.4